MCRFIAKLTMLSMVIAFPIFGNIFAQEPEIDLSLIPSSNEHFDSTYDISISISSTYLSDTKIPLEITVSLTNSSEHSINFKHRNGIAGPFVFVVRYKGQWMIDTNQRKLFGPSAGYPEMSDLELSAGETILWRAPFSKIISGDVNIKDITEPGELYISTRSTALYVENVNDDGKTEYIPLRISVKL